MAEKFVVITDSGTPTHTSISQNRKFFPYFQNCRMAVDGTHLPICVGLKDADRYRGRKGLTQNVLAAGSFDLIFTYVLAGWEGAAADGRIFSDALQKGYTVDPHRFDLADAGFALTPYMLTPYRRTRYHLKEFLQGNQR